MTRQAMILVGGLGTRLGALTQETPKPMLEVGGRPFLTWLVDDLVRRGVEDVVLLAGYRGEQIEALAADRSEVRVLVEHEPLGTGGALRFAADLLDPWFFLLNGDSVFDVNLWDLALFAGEDADAALALRAVPDLSRYGPATLAGDRIVEFSERGGGGPGLINGGVALLSRTVLDRIPSSGVASIEREVYPALASDGRLRGRAYDRPFIDIGVPEDFEVAQQFIPNLYRRGAVIFDRDGVLNEDVVYAHRADQIVWVEGAIEAVKAVNDAGLFAFVATNQAGVARGYYPEEQVHALHRWMNEQLKARGARIDAFAYSPFHPEGVVEAYRRDARCRKPAPGMILDLLAQFPVDPARTLMIGDQPTDVAAAEAAGVRGVLFEGGDLRDRLRPLLERL